MVEWSETSVDEMGTGHSTVTEEEEHTHKPSEVVLYCRGTPSTLFTLVLQVWQLATPHVNVSCDAPPANICPACRIQDNDSAALVHCLSKKYQHFQQEALAM